MYAIDQITQYKRLQADIGGLTTLYAIIKAEKHKEKEPKPRVRFRFLLAGDRSSEHPAADTRHTARHTPAAAAKNFFIFFSFMLPSEMTGQISVHLNPAPPLNSYMREFDGAVFPSFRLFQKTNRQSLGRLSPPAPFAQGSHGVEDTVPPLLAQGSHEAGGHPTTHASPFGKGRCRAERDGGDKKVLFRYSKSKRLKSIRKKGVTCYVLFALVRNGNKVKRAAGERGKKPAVSRTARRR